MILMHENIPVADVTMYLGHITAVNKLITPEHLPVGTYHPGPLLPKYLDSWMRDRSIPFERHSLEVYTHYFGCSPLEAAQISGSFSLTDHYWLKQNEDDLKWEDVCFHKNGFSDHFANFMLDTLNDKNLIISSRNLNIPDINTDGVLQKMWIQEDGIFKLVKLGEYEENSNIHLLSANEVACSKIAKMCDISTVEYQKIVLLGSGSIVCECNNFIPEGYEYVTFLQFSKIFAGNSFDLYQKIIEMGHKKKAEELIFLFYLLHNKDGHTKNCGFLRDAKTLEIKTLAPIFDLGCSLNYDRLGNADCSVKPFRANRIEQLSLLEEFPDLPNFDNVSQIIKDTYDEFGVSETQAEVAIMDLMNTYNEYEKCRDVEYER